MTLEKIIASDILSRKLYIVGIYCLIMKSGSDNFRSSAIQDIIRLIKAKGVEVIIYEPALNEPEFNGCPVINDIDDFKNDSSIILANRFSDGLSDVPDRIYTRDLFARD